MLLAGVVVSGDEDQADEAMWAEDVSGVFFIKKAYSSLYANTPEDQWPE